MGEEKQKMRFPPEVKAEMPLSIVESLFVARVSRCSAPPTSQYR
jgi:hypothetical protein